MILCYLYHRLLLLPAKLMTLNLFACLLDVFPIHSLLHIYSLLIHPSSYKLHPPLYPLFSYCCVCVLHFLLQSFFFIKCVCVGSFGSFGSTSISIYHLAFGVFSLFLSHCVVFVVHIGRQFVVHSRKHSLSPAQSIYLSLLLLLFRQ